jgi:SAM-dependent methyltransferase
MTFPKIIHPQTKENLPRDPIPNLLSDGLNETAAHYSKQWGDDMGYTKFIRNAPTAAKHTMARQLGWPELFDRIRAEAANRNVAIYDAACGFGLIHRDLFAAPTPGRLSYVGADIHEALGSIENPFSSSRFVRFDVSERLPTDDSFDFVVCRAALHHTPDPERTLGNLASVLKPGGTLAISVYTKKTPMRDSSDDYLRSKITPMTPDDAFYLVRQFSSLGKDLQQSTGEIIINDDLPFLGIKSGKYPIQQFVYDHFLKCWFNSEFGEEWSDIVNFDWYHPPYAYRYTLQEAIAMNERCGLNVVKTESNKAQHYIEATKPG